MPRNPRQKQKLLYLQKILLEKTDEKNGLTISELIEELNQYDISAERKSIYDDLRTLENFGLDICSEKTKTVKYYIGSRDFQISELKLLVDAIQSSKFITQKKSIELIKKLESLASVNEAKLMQRQVYVSNRVKAGNETIYYNVDRLHEAINNDSMIEFDYYNWTLNLGSVEKIKLIKRKNGKKYIVSPWGLCWDDENYYLIAYNSEYQEIRHYRVDKMQSIQVLDKKREGKEVFKKFDIGSYTKSTFSMFSGEFKNITLSVHKDLIGVMVDRFGKNIFITPDKENEEFFLMDINVNLSQQFYGWLFALGDKVKLVSPNNAVEEFENQLLKVQKLYQKEE